MLRDCLVCGLAQAQSQQCLLAEVDLNFDKVMKTAQAIKLAEHNTREFWQAKMHTVTPVHKVHSYVGKQRQDPSTLTDLVHFISLGLRPLLFQLSNPPPQPSTVVPHLDMSPPSGY